MQTAYKIIIYIILNAMLFTQTGDGSFSVIGHFPKGEFKEQCVTTGLGLDLNAELYPVPELGFGMNLGGSIYDQSERSIPFSYYSDLITITERIENTIFHGHLFFKIKPLAGIQKKYNIQPYVEGLVGFKNLQTNVSLYSENCYDDPDTSHNECEIASSIIDAPESQNSTALSYGVGGGIEIIFPKNNNKKGDSENLFFYIGGRYLYGAEATYLKEGDIEFSDPEDGPVESTFNWNQSKTDLLQINVGIGIKLK